MKAYKARIPESWRRMQRATAAHPTPPLSNYDWSAIALACLRWLGKVIVITAILIGVIFLVALLFAGAVPPVGYRRRRCRY